MSMFAPGFKCNLDQNTFGFQNKRPPWYKKYGEEVLFKSY